MMDDAAAREIERWKDRAETAEAAASYWESEANYWRTTASKSERQRKQLSEYIETLAKGGIEAATGAREIDRLKGLLEVSVNAHAETIFKLRESERQRKALAEHLEALGVEGINAATGAGR